MVYLIDDDTGFHDQFKSGFRSTGVELTLECFTKVSDLSEAIRALEKAGRLHELQGLIIDLSNSKEEDTSKRFAVSDVIDTSFANNSIPIFIHSAYLRYYEEYEDYGTVFKVKKSADSVPEICKLLKLMAQSGFLEVFSINGILHKWINTQIHRTFTEQFKGKEISKILESINHASKDVGVFRERTAETFTRMAIRVLYQHVISAKRDGSNQIAEIEVNAIEHYYRRKSDFPVWTGDVFENQRDGLQVIVLTPRCDINNGACMNRFLVCRIVPLDIKQKSEMSTAKESVRYSTDNPLKSGWKSRFLVPVPSYPGGKIDLGDYSILGLAELAGTGAHYKYIVSLSDELTNEVVRKFSAFLLRGGILATDTEEAIYYAQEAATSQDTTNNS